MAKLQKYSYRETPTSAKLNQMVDELNSDTQQLSELSQNVKELSGAVEGKQDTIKDIEAIRRGATAGATALQPVEGKGLSSNDFTNEDKQKLAGLENYDDTELKENVSKKVDKQDGQGLSKVANAAVTEDGKLNIEKQDGTVIEFEGGGDSNFSINDNGKIDFAISDENGNIIVEFTGGHIRTQKFNSKNIVNVNNATSCKENNWWSPQFLQLQVGSHRGDSVLFPENTMPAIESAYNKGTHWIEVDIMQSKDGEQFLLHDRNVARTSNGSGDAETLTSEQLLSLDFGYSTKFGDKYIGTKIPTLREFLIWCNRRNVIAELDMDYSGSGGRYLPSYVLKTIQIVSETAMWDRVVLCVDKTIMDVVYAIKPDVTYLVTYDNYEQFKLLYPIARPIVSIPPSASDIFNKNAKVHSDGNKTRSYLLGYDNIETGERMLSFGIDYLLSDNTYQNNY